MEIPHFLLRAEYRFLYGRHRLVVSVCGRELRWMPTKAVNALARLFRMPADEFAHNGLRRSAVPASTPGGA